MIPTTGPGPATPSGRGPAPLILAIDGRSGAGKTSLAVETAALLRPHLSVSVFHLDSIYPGWDGLAASLPGYVREVVAPLAAGRPAHWRWWDWTTGAPGRADSTAPADVVILEGVGAGHRQARPLVHAVAWVAMAQDKRKRRALGRDGETFAPHWDRWAAQEADYLASDDVADAAWLHVDGQAATPAAAADLVAGLRSLPGWDTALALVPSPGPRRWAHRLLPEAADPQALFAAAGGPEAGTALLLESSDREVTPAPERSRYSILGLATAASPRAEHRAGTTTVRSGHVTVRRPGAFFPWLATVWPDAAGTPGSAGAAMPGGGPFQPGWMGWIGYGLKRETGSPDGAATRAEPATDRDEGPAGGGVPATPEALLFRPGRGATVDHVAGTTVLYWPSEDPEGPAWADSTIRGLGPESAIPPDSAAPWPTDPFPAPVFALRDSREQYLAKIRTAQDEIVEGNTYEVCLTTQLEATADGFDGWSTYRRLAAANRAPFTLYLRAVVGAGVGPGVGQAAGTPVRPLEILSTSPERFLAISSVAAGSRLVTEPIKGTRPRGATDAEDRGLAAELAASVKDRAENIMITDLARNDLSRFAVPGTLATTRVCAIESYPTVHQMVSTVTARLEPGAPRADALAAAFPPGSMTGAPKISTMDLLERLEAGPRGVYSGVAGYLSADGAADLNVLIRTLVAVPVPAPGPGTTPAGHGAHATHLSLGVGGAITADSVPTEEWDEVRTKAHGVLRVLGSAFPED